jgi:hypothetical protein
MNEFAGCVLVWNYNEADRLIQKLLEKINVVIVIGNP